MFAKQLPFYFPFPLEQGPCSPRLVHCIQFIRNVIYSIDEKVLVCFFHTLWHKFDSTVLFTVTAITAWDFLNIILLLSFVIHSLLFFCHVVKEFISSLIVNSCRNLYVRKIRNNKYFWHNQWTNNIVVFFHFLYFTYLLINKVDLTIVHIMKAVEGIKAVALLILKHGTRWRWVVNLMPCPF